ERALDFHCTDAVSRNVQHVVDATQNPEVAVLVPLRAVAGEVDVRLAPLGPVHLAVALIVAPDRPQHTGPGPGNREIAAAHFHFLAFAVEQHRFDPGKRDRRGAGFGARHAGQRRDHDSARLGLPPGVDDGTAAAADVLLIPDPRLRIDRLPYGTQQPE